jgi:hypothetical protein
MADLKAELAELSLKCGWEAPVSAWFLDSSGLAATSINDFTVHHQRRTSQPS